MTTAGTPQEMRDLADKPVTQSEVFAYLLSLKAALHAAADRIESGTRLIRDFTDPDDCWFDHHGGCQAHGYLTLQPGDLCPHAEAKRDWLAADPDTTPEPQQETT